MLGYAQKELYELTCVACINIETKSDQKHKKGVDLDVSDDRKCYVVMNWGRVCLKSGC